jgi:PAS domain S-box-containing protein
MAAYGDNESLRIVAYIVASTIIIFYLDIITPLGLAVWILYFIPLFLTLYLRWKWSSLVATGGFIVLIGSSFFLSPRDTSLLFALANRVFFSSMLVVSSVLIWYYHQSIESMMMSEVRYRSLTEWSPEAVIVYRNGQIVYTNPAGVALFGATTNDELKGRNIVDLIDPSQKDLMRTRIDQAMMGARMALDRIGISRLNGSHLVVDASLGKIVWCREPALQIILRSAGSS